jgi:hypothetical protein
MWLHVLTHLFFMPLRLTTGSTLVLAAGQSREVCIVVGIGIGLFLMYMWNKEKRNPPPRE